MPNKSIKREKVYRGLRRRGNSKQRSARIANAGKRGSRKGGKRSR